MPATKKKSVTGKRVLYRLVDSLPTREVPAARRYLEYLRDMGSDPFLRALASAPVDDEAETPEEAAAVQEGRDAIARGDVVSDEELRRELGL
jgi:hypothetical protein